MGLETPSFGERVPPTEEVNKSKEGLGAEKNRLIAEYLMSGNHDGLLRIISQEQDKETACAVIVKSMVDFNKGGRAKSINGLLTTALNNVKEYGNSLKELILYTWKNNLRGERFWKNPYKAPPIRRPAWK